MARNIPDSRFGRALMAGIPVACAMLGAELLDGSWKVDRRDGAFVLSWMSVRDAPPPPDGSWSVAISLSAHPLGPEMASFARSMVSAVTGDCAEQGARERPLASA